MGHWTFSVGCKLIVVSTLSVGGMLQMPTSLPFLLLISMNVRKPCILINHKYLIYCFAVHYVQSLCLSSHQGLAGNTMRCLKSICQFQIISLIFIFIFFPFSLLMN